MVNGLIFFHLQTSTTALITYVKTVDRAKMVSTVTRVAAQLDTVGTIVRIVSSNFFIFYYYCSVFYKNI